MRAPLPSRLAVLLVLLLAAATLGAAGTVTFQRRGAAQEGQTWRQTSTWHTTGHSLIKVGGITLNDKPIDRLTHYVAGVSVHTVVDDVVTDLLLEFVEQVEREGESSEDLGLDQVAVRMTGGRGDRTFARVDGARLKRPQKKWLAGQFEGREEEEEEKDRAGGEEEEDKDDAPVNPLDLLVPDQPTAPGASWAMSLDAIEAFFGPDRFRFDRATSRATVTLHEVRDWHGTPTGRFSFEVQLVPNWIKDGEITLASMALTGTAELPLDGSSPYMAFDVVTDMRFVGWVRRRGVKADVDLTMRFTGSESHVPRGK